MLYPFTFHPIFKQRVWGGRELEPLYGKGLPPSAPIGESWEVSDRPGDVSVIANGPLAGKDLRWLLEQHSSELLGHSTPPEARFPLLIKILDAREKLSLQVHPPPAKAAQLGGEPKTEMWYIAHAEPGAELYAGLKQRVTRAGFEQKLRDGSVADCFHRIPVQAGDAMFLPSGRVHAIGAGLVIFEIQQNSDTTYRVFDWNRAGLDGKPRPLHLRESLESIDFQDFEPGLVSNEFRPISPGTEIRSQTLVNDPLFVVQRYRIGPLATFSLQPHRMQILGVISGQLELRATHLNVLLPGQFVLIPACLAQASISTERPASFLLVQLRLPDPVQKE